MTYFYYATQKNCLFSYRYQYLGTINCTIYNLKIQELNIKSVKKKFKKVNSKSRWTRQAILPNDVSTIFFYSDEIFLSKVLGS